MWFLLLLLLLELYWVSCATKLSSICSNRKSRSVFPLIPFLPFCRFVSMKQNINLSFALPLFLTRTQSRKPSTPHHLSRSALIASPSCVKERTTHERRLSNERPTREGWGTNDQRTVDGDLMNLASDPWERVDERMTKNGRRRPGESGERPCDAC